MMHQPAEEPSPALAGHAAIDGLRGQWHIIVGGLVAFNAALALADHGGVRWVVPFVVMGLASLPILVITWVNRTEERCIQQYLLQLYRTPPCVADATARLRHLEWLLARWRRWHGTAMLSLYGFAVLVVGMALRGDVAQHPALFWLGMNLCVGGIGFLSYGAWVVNRRITAASALRVWLLEATYESMPENGAPS